MDISRILSNPEFYNNKDICLRGYFSYNFEDVAIYASQQSLNSSNTQKSIWIDLSDKFDINTINLDEFDGKLVIVNGIFNSKSKGHLNQYKGTILVTSIVQL